MKIFTEATQWDLFLERFVDFLELTVEDDKDRIKELEAALETETDETVRQCFAYCIEARQQTAEYLEVVRYAYEHDTTIKEAFETLERHRRTRARFDGALPETLAGFEWWNWKLR